LVKILDNAWSSRTVETPKFKFSKDPRYFVPNPDGYDAMLEFLRELPVVQPPEIFGMHDNVDISKEMMQTNLLFDAVLITQSKAGKGGAGGTNLEDIAQGILDKVPPNFDIEMVGKKYPVTYGESMNTVLVQEMQRFNRLTTVVRSTLINLGKALKGLVLLNADLENVGASLTVGKVPAPWLKASYPSLKPLGSYVADFLRRLAFFEQWNQEGKPPQFWLPGFYFTQAFLTGALQNYARKYTVPIDDVGFGFVCLPVDPTPADPPPEDGVHVYGLYLDGARWDVPSQKLAEMEPKKLFSDMAYMHYVPMRLADIDNSGKYTCPIYKTSVRQGKLSTTGHSTNFVLAIQVPSDQDEDHWIRRGLALLTQLDD
jgi:dynein heavy chain